MLVNWLLRSKLGAQQKPSRTDFISTGRSRYFHSPFRRLCRTDYHQFKLDQARISLEMSPDRKPSQKTPWPAYFIVRTTGEVVPLIAVDELPKGIDLVGVSRSFDLEDTIGMLNLGVERSSGAFYQTIQSLDSNSALPSAARKSRYSS
jgi:hypothetical protein